MDASSGYGLHFSLRILVLPVVPLRTSEFEKHLKLLKEHSRISLADIPPPSIDSSVLSALAPTPTSRGFLNFHFVTRWDQDQAWLEEFQIHRKVVAVVGLLDCAEWQDEGAGESLQDGARKFQELVREKAPRDVSARRCYAFNPSDSQKDNADGLVVIPNVGDLGFYMNTLLAELASSVLAGLSRVMTSLDSRSFVSTPKERPSSMSTSASNSYFPPQAVNHAIENRQTTGEILSRAKSPHILSGSAQDRSSSPIAMNNQFRPISVAIDPIDAKLRKRLPARLFKLKGDLYCLAGRVDQGMGCYSEAVALTKSTGDVLWQAAATESLLITQVYQSWLQSQPMARGSIMASRRPSLAELAKQPAEPAMFNNPLLGKELPAQYASVLALYAKSAAQRNSGSGYSEGTPVPSTPGVAADTDEIIHPLLYIETCFRFIRSQMAILSNGGVWNQAAISLIVGLSGRSWPVLDATEFFKLGLNGAVSRADVSKNITLAYAHLYDFRLRRQERIQFLSAILNLYTYLHYPRKRGTIYRELAAITSDAISHRKPHEQETKGARSSMDITAAYKDKQPTVVRSLPEAEGNETVVRLMEKACLAYGVPIVPPSELAGKENGEQQSTSIMRSEANMLLLDSANLTFGWPDLQLALVKDAITVSEVLPDYQGAIRFTITALRELADVMLSSDQYRFSQSIPRLLSASARRGSPFQMAYWGPQSLVMSVEVASLHPSLIPTEHPYRYALAAASTAASALDNRDKVFYSAAKSKAKITKPTLVQRELAELFVTLQNPFLFDLEIESIEVSTSGIPCKANNMRSSVPPSSFHTIRISCIPASAGTLIIRGCKIRIAGCAEREFIVPLEQSSTSASSKQKRLSNSFQRDRVKSSGLQAWQDGEKNATHEQQEEDLNFLECTIVPELPMLRVKATNLTHGAIMLFDGETSLIRLTLENTSQLPIDFVKLAFEDSHTNTMKIYLSETEVPESQVFEIERDATNRPVLRWANQSEAGISVQPGSEMTLEISCTGKMGLTNGTIQLDYAYIERSEDPAPSIFHTRQIKVPISISVHPTIQCTALNILPVDGFPSSGRQRHQRSLSVTSIGRALAIDNFLEDGLRDMEADTSCLLVLEVRNDSLTQTFEAVFETKDGSGGRIKQTIDSGATVNLLLPASRVSLPDEHIQRPVPSLSNKQFVVGKDKTTQEELEMFWYREELMRNFKLTWREVGTRRSGGTSLDTLQLTREALAAYKLQEVGIEVALKEDDVDLEQNEHGEWCASCGAFLDLEVKVRNRGARRLVLTASLNHQHTEAYSTLFDAQVTPLPAFSQAATGDSVESEFLSRHILIDGTTAVPLRALDPGKEEMASAIFPICILSKGSFSLICQLTHEEVAVAKRSINIVVS